MLSRSSWTFLSALFLAIGLAIFFGLRQRQARVQSYLTQLQENGLNVYTLNSATTFYENRLGQPDGFEYQLVRDFARHLNAKIHLQVKSSVAEVLDAVKSDPLGVAAAGLSRTPARRHHFLFGPAYLKVTTQLICHQYRHQSALGFVVISKNTSYRELLNLSSVGHWKESPLPTEEILSQVNRDKRFCTLADSNIFDINRRYLSNIRAEADLEAPSSISWLFSKQAPYLKGLIEDWFSNFSQSGQLSKLVFRHYGFVSEQDPYATHKFRQHYQTRLPKIRGLFEKAAKKYNFHWTTLAAISYQESQWRPKAKSPTGVRGLMMLTQTTASAMGIKNRLDPAQSIFGGARYLKQLQERLPTAIEGDDRLWMALAAYNVGMGHLLDARTLARRRGLNPNLWQDLRQVLPALAKEAVYRHLEHGYARGWEPVRYVQAIRDYQDRIRQLLQESLS